ncbi:MAG: T9SS type A sorting domain-containing protein [Bacteroidetes bacterium]|nr:T9SS type A sorting domain-containing protein [Bacteroidota bacterium]
MIDTNINNAQDLLVKFRISNANNCNYPMVYVNGYPSTTFPDQFQLNGACVSCSGSTYVEYGLSGFTPGTGSSPGMGGTLITNPVFPLTISSLTPAATYDVYTRENCGGGLGFSSNSIKTTITMPCNYGPSSISSNLTTICPGTVVNLTVNGGTPGPNGIYKIYADSCGGTLIGTGTTTTVSPSKTTIYFARIESPCGNSYCVSRTIFVNPTATITPAGSTTFCSGGNVTLNANTGTGLTYQWKKYGNPIAGATASSYVATGSGSYRVVVTNASGCSASASPVTVTVNLLPSASITATGSTAICPGSSVSLNANTGAGLNYQWKKYSNDISGATGATYAATGAGTYKVRVTDANGCSKTSNNIAVTVLPSPTASITATGSTTFCAGDSVKLAAASGAGNTYQWRKGSSVINGATGLNYYAKTTGNYKVTVTATNGCTKNSNVIAVNVPCRVGEFAEIPFDIYPNPSSGIFKVVIHENETATLEIKDLTGKIIYMDHLNKNETEVDLTALAAGIYLAELQTSQMRVVRKIVIQK